MYKYSRDSRKIFFILAVAMIGTMFGLAILLYQGKFSSIQLRVSLWISELFGVLILAKAIKGYIFTGSMSFNPKMILLGLVAYGVFWLAGTGWLYFVGIASHFGMGLHIITATAIISLSISAIHLVQLNSEESKLQ
jgi:hypothetical protein